MQDEPFDHEYLEADTSELLPADRKDLVVQLFDSDSCELCVTRGHPEEIGRPGFFVCTHCQPMKIHPAVLRHQILLKRLSGVACCPTCRSRMVFGHTIRHDGDTHIVSPTPAEMRRELSSSEILNMEMFGGTSLTNCPCSLCSPETLRTGQLTCVPPVHKVASYLESKLASSEEEEEEGNDEKEEKTESRKFILRGGTVYSRCYCDISPMYCPCGCPDCFDATYRTVGILDYRINMGLCPGGGATQH